jgi:hypothetical protein
MCTRWQVAPLVFWLALGGCSSGRDQEDGGEDGVDAAVDAVDGGDAADGVDAADGEDGGDGADQGGPVERCAALPPPAGRVVRVAPAQAAELTGIVSGLAEGDTLLFEDGTYALGGAYLWVSTAGVTLRSASGDREAVVLDGEYTTTEVITVAASGVTLADLTIRRPYTHAIHVTTGDAGDTLGTRIYNVHVVDPREQAIKINPGAVGFPDQGEIACCHLELTAAGRPNVNPTATGCYTGGVDGHQARGWVLRDNLIEGFWCPSGLSEHAIHLWRGSRDTLVERNRLRNNARGVGFGLATEGDARTYADAACPGLPAGTYVDHYLGLVRNNSISADDPDLLASPGGFDCGVCLWSACGAQVVHNSVASTGALFSAIEWRFAASRGIALVSNLATHPLREREDAQASLTGNLDTAPLALFVDAASGDLHLAPGAALAIDQGSPLAPGVCDDDMDAEPRDAHPDLGADEL